MERVMVWLKTQLFQASATVCHCLTSFKVKIQLDHLCIGDHSRALPVDASVGTENETRIVIADTPLMDQDGRGRYSEQSIVDIPEDKKDM